MIEADRCFPSWSSWLRPAISLLLLFILTIPVSGEQPKADLETIRTEITRLRHSLDRVKGETRTAEDELEAIQLELAIHTKEVDMASAVEAQLAAEKGLTERQIESLSSEIARQKRFLIQRLGALYRMGSLSYLRILLSLERDRNPFEAASMLSYVVARDARAVGQYQSTREVLALRQSELAGKESRLLAATAALELRRGEVERTRQSKQAFLDRLRNESNSSQVRLSELEEKARRLEKLFALLYEHDTGGLSGAKIADYAGALDWPVTGEVTEEFGRQRNAKFSTVTVSNGLKIASPSGSDVRAVFQGTVLFSQWFKGYGNLIIVDHGNRIFSLYGNTAGARVAVGDRVEPGQVIASVAAEEDGSASYLYFEIREDNKPADPRKWLR